MIARVLPPEEWGRLEPTGLSPIWSTVRPEDIEMLVVEDEGHIVARLSVLRVTHLEGLWIAPEYRGNAGLGRRLMGLAVETARRWTDAWAMGFAADDRMRDILARVGGVKLPIDSYVLPLGTQKGAIACQRQS